MKNYSACRLCPRNCGIDRTKQTGVCGETDALRVARAALHFWEEPCLSGTVGSGTVFFAGCGLRCVFCQNQSIAHGHRGREITTERLADIFSELEAQGALNINLVTPTHFVPHIRAALNLARTRGMTLPVVYNSSGYESVETLRSLDGYVDIYLPDFKYASPTLAGALSAAPDYPDVARAAIAEMVRQCGDIKFRADGIMERGVIVRHLVLPGHTDDSMAVLRELYETYGDRIYLSIMSQFTPCVAAPAAHPELDRKLTKYEYQKVVAFAEKIGIRNGFLQGGEAAAESFIPDFDETGVSPK